jgi:hypothetical protein
VMGDGCGWMLSGMMARADRRCPESCRGVKRSDVTGGLREGWVTAFFYHQMLEKHESHPRQSPH